MTLDELLEKHPAPWTFDAGSDVYRDANRKQLFGIFVSAALMDSVNRIHEMRGEMDAIKAENAARKARVAELSRELREIHGTLNKANNELLRYRTEEIKQSSVLAWAELPVVHPSREQRRFEAACAVLTGSLSDGNPMSPKWCVSQADALLAALDKPKAPPEPPPADVWRIDESRTIENEQWYEINKGERAANIEGLEREEVERIVAALNGGER